MNSFPSKELANRVTGLGKTKGLAPETVTLFARRIAEAEVKARFVKGVMEPIELTKVTTPVPAITVND
jgi:hypothetical protein